MATGEPIISVLVSTRDRPQALRRCLQSVARQQYDDMEIVVLDDASRDPVAIETLRSWTPGCDRISCMRSSERLGVARGRNRLMAEARGRYLVVIDDDAEFAHEGCLTATVGTFETHPAVSVLAFRIVNHHAGRTELWVPFSRVHRRRDPQLTDAPQRVSYFYGTGHAIRRELLDECGGYDPDLVYGEEEIEFSYRAIERQAVLMYTPDVTVHHHPLASVIDRTETRSELYYHVRNRLMLAHRYIPARYLPSYLLVWSLRLAGRAAATRRPTDFVLGLRDGVTLVRRLRRTPLSRTAVGYLRDHYGRLWC